MLYIELLPDDLILSILDSRCNDIEEEIRILEINIEYCEAIMNDVNSDIDTLSYYSSTDDDDDDDDVEHQQQQHNDQVWLDNMDLNMNLDMIHTFNTFHNLNM
jgi:hypothetical protein